MRAAIVLAAGRSRRFGSVNKLLARYRGRPLMHHALSAACAAPAGRVLVVAGNDPRVARCVRAFGNRRIEIVGPVRSESRRESLEHGLSVLRPIEREAFIFLGDMPFVAPSLARRLVMGKGGPEARRPVWRARLGHPVLLRQPRTVLARLGQDISPFPEAGTMACTRLATFDIDRPGALRVPGISR